MTLPVLLAQVEVTAGNLVVAGIVSIIAGIVILVYPRVLNYVVAFYLILVGILWLVAGL